MKIIETFPNNPTVEEKNQLAAFVRIKKQASDLIPEEREKYQGQADDGRDLLQRHKWSTVVRAK